MPSPLTSMLWLARSILTTTAASARSPQSPQAKNHTTMAVAQSSRRIAIPQPSTTLADLLTPLLVANRFSAIRASLRRWSSDEFEDGVAYGGEGWVRGGAGCFFFFFSLGGGG